VIYDAGDWVEYGSDGGGEAFQTELYGAADLLVLFGTAIFGVPEQAVT